MVDFGGYGPLAQSVEQRTFNPWVVGSIPTGPTNYASAVTYPLLTSRLSIEPLADCDLESFVAYRQDPEIARFQSWDTNYAKEQAIGLIESQAGVSLPSEGNWLQLAVHDLVTKELIGDVAVHLVSANEAIYELGFTVGKVHQQKGYASEAVSVVIGLLVKAGARKLIAHTDNRNEPSIRLLGALSFTQKLEKSWSENFKDELVTVDYFELTL